jgi:hypothetical protein
MPDIRRIRTGPTPPFVSGDYAVSRDPLLREVARLPEHRSLYRRLVALWRARHEPQTGVSDESAS